MTVQEAMVGIASQRSNILLFLQEVTLKALRVLAAPLLLRADKCATSWFHQWYDSNLKQHANLYKTAPQDHSRLMVVLSEVVMCLQNAKSLRPVIVA